MSIPRFSDELVKQYETEGLSHEEAETKARENLVMTSLPKLPESGDLTEEDPAWIDTKTMGGVNGYAISAYTKAPNACLAFVDFATSYEMMIKRSEMLGIAPGAGRMWQSSGWYGRGTVFASGGRKYHFNAVRKGSFPDLDTGADLLHRSGKRRIPAGE